MITNTLENPQNERNCLFVNCIEMASKTVKSITISNLHICHERRSPQNIDSNFFLQDMTKDFDTCAMQSPFISRLVR